MSDDIKISFIVMGGVLALALIITGGLLLSQWIEFHEVKDIHLYLPGSHG